MLTGHTDSVTSVGFSSDGVYLATADMGGLIKVWEVSSWKEVWSFQCSDIEVCPYLFLISLIGAYIFHLMHTLFC